jgi:hypothetical protein
VNRKSFTASASAVIAGSSAKGAREIGAPLAHRPTRRAPSRSAVRPGKSGVAASAGGGRTQEAVEGGHVLPEATEHQSEPLRTQGGSSGGQGRGPPVTRSLEG